jgi:hypothetical protein
MSITLTGILMVAVTQAIQVVMSQARATDGRSNNTRSEINIGLYLPNDLASAETVQTEANASPCGTTCPGPEFTAGSNALMLTWKSSKPGVTGPIPVVYTVSYRYIEELPGVYVIVRVECETVGTDAPTCAIRPIVDNAEKPPQGVNFVPGVTAPTWALVVSVAQDPALTGNVTATTVAGSDPTYRTKNGQRVTVTVNGGGTSSGGGGGIDRITLSAGGTDRVEVLDTQSFDNVPTFSATRSRCGGNYGLIVDVSGSIGSNITYVRQGVVDFVNAFAGTPIKIQMVAFAGVAKTSGADDTVWTRYYDLLNPADVSALIASAQSLDITKIDGQTFLGGTNWEDALFRMFRNKDGTVQAKLPKTVIFFTDGVPTRSRRSGTTATAPVTDHPEDAYLWSEFGSDDGSGYLQLGWSRANRVAREFDSDVDRFIGVLVGDDADGSSPWQNPGPGFYMTNWQRGYRITGWQRAGSGLTYERKISATSWSSVSRSTYESNNTSPGDSDGWRARVTGALGSWSSTTETNYNRSNTVDTDADGFRVIKSYSAPFSLWEPVTEATYDANNSKPDNTDGWWGTPVYAEPYKEWLTPLPVGTTNATVLGRVVTTGAAVAATKDGAGNYNNALVADLYVEPNWTKFSSALTSVALAECGGTVTVQTKVNGTWVADPFKYQNSRDNTYATTSGTYKSGTFDFSIPSGQFIDVTLTPLELSSLSRYSPVNWECKAGPTVLPITTATIPGTPWQKVTVRVQANQAVSCVQNVAVI